MANRDSILKDALTLPADERAELIDTLLSGLDEPDREIDALWGMEANARLDAYDRGELEAIPLSEVLSKYGKEQDPVGLMEIP